MVKYVLGLILIFLSSIFITQAQTQTREISNVSVNAREELTTFENSYKQNAPTRVAYHISNGMLNGKYISYKNGMKIAEGTFENNNRVGDWKVWDSTGNLKIERVYINEYEYKSILPKQLADTPLYTPKRNTEGYYAYPTLYVKEKVIIWSQRTWSYIYNKVNPLLGNGNRLFRLMYSEIKQRNLIAYQYYNTDIDYGFNKSLDSTKVPLDTMDYRVIGYITKEDRFYDSSREVLDYRIISICPIAIINHRIKDTIKEAYLKENTFSHSSDTVGLFWIYYPQIRKYLATEKVSCDTVPKQIQNLDDVFFWTYYNSSIFMRSAVIAQLGRVYDSWNAHIGYIELEHEIWLIRSQ